MANSSHAYFWWRMARSRRTAPAPPPATLDLKQAIVAALRADPDFVALAGASLFPDNIPQTARLPAVCYGIIGSYNATHLRGAAGMRNVRMRFEIAGPLAADIERIKEVIRDRMQGLIGPLSGLPIAYVTFETESDGYYPPVPGSDVGTHYKDVDMNFKLRESIPTLA